MIDFRPLAWKKVPEEHWPGEWGKTGMENGGECMWGLCGYHRVAQELAWRDCRSTLDRTPQWCILGESGRAGFLSVDLGWVLCWVLKAHLPGRLPEAKAQSQSLTSSTIAKSSRLN